MRNVMTSLILVTFLAAAGAAPAAAAVEKYTIDPGHSSVGFKIRHFVSKVPGRFDRYSGTIELDPSDLTTAKVSVEIETASIDTDVPDRDKHLRAADFFDVDNHPKMTFVSRQVIPKGANKVAVIGDLTLRGVTKPVVIEAEVLGFSPDGQGGVRSGFEATTTINRKDFGMTWNRTLDSGGLILGEDVEIVLNVEAAKVMPEAPSKAGGTSGR